MDARSVGLVVGNFYKIKTFEEGFNVGEILKFESDDGTDCPWFCDAQGQPRVPYVKNVDPRPVRSFEDGRYVQSPDSPASKRGLVVGKQYLVAGMEDSRAAGFGSGALVIFESDDDSACPLFKSVLNSKTRYLDVLDVVNVDGTTPAPVVHVAPKTPAEIAGITEGTFVKYTGNAELFAHGDVLILAEDDGSCCPYFKHSSLGQEAYVSLGNVTILDVNKPIVEVRGDVMVATLLSAEAKATFNSAFNIRQAYKITGNTNYHKFEVGDVVYKGREKPILTPLGGTKMTTDIDSLEGEDAGWVLDGDMEAI